MSTRRCATAQQSPWVARRAFKKLSNEVREFYRLAEQACECAEAATDSSARKDLHLVEQGWLRLARMHQEAEAA